MDKTIKTSRKKIPDQLESETVPVSLFKSIYKLPISKFQDCYCDNDLSSLIISGNPSEEELKEVWEEILSQYYEALAGPEQEYYYELISSLNDNKIRLSQIVMLAEVLRNAWIEKFAKELHKLTGVKLSNDITNYEVYEQQLKRALAKTAPISLKIQNLETELRSILESGMENRRPPSRSNYEKTLITLSDYAGRELDPETLMTYSYCERIKRYNRHIERKHLNASEPWQQ